MEKIYPMLFTTWKTYSKEQFLKDLIAGIVVAIIALPLSIALALASGVGPEQGIYTAIVAGFIISFLGGSQVQIAGPTAAFATIVAGIVARNGMDGLAAATILAGIILIIMGLCRFGGLIKYIPFTITTGFTSGIAIVIALGQIDNFFGTHSEGASTIAKLASYGTLGFHPNLTSVGIGLFVVLFMVFFPKKWNAVVPASLVSIILTTAFSIFVGLEVPTVGTIPQTLFPEKRLLFSALDLTTVTNLIMPAFSIAILGMIESLLCGASAGQMTGVRLKSNQELIAQGVGNILLPFFGGIPATAAIARTSVAIRSGAKTRLTGMFHAVGLLISMFLLAPVMSQIPMAALAGVLMVTAWRMNEWNSILYMFSHKFKGAMLEFLATMIATIVFDLTIAILVGVVIGLIFLVSRLSFIEINYEKVDMERLRVTDPALRNRYNNAMVAYITGPMIFANTQNVADISTKIGNCDTLLLSMRGVSNIDISCAQTLRTLIGNLRMKGVDVVLCGLPSRAMEMMRRTDLDEYVGKENFYWSVERALLTNRPLPPCREK